MILTVLAKKNILGRPVRTFLLCTITACICGMVFSFAVLMQGITYSVRTGFSRFGADVLVVPENAVSQASAILLSGEPTSFTMQRSVIDQIYSIRGVIAASPQLFLKPLPFSCCFDVKVFLIAFEPSTDFTLAPWLKEGSLDGFGSGEIIVGRKIPAQVGDSIPFFGTRFTIKGKLEPTGVDFLDRGVFMTFGAATSMARNSRKLAREPLEIKEDAISSVLVRTDRKQSPEEAAIRIEHLIPGVKTLVPDTLVTVAKKNISVLITAIIVGGCILWLAFFLLLGFAFSAIVQERKREIGILRSLGATRCQVAILISLEGSIISSIGCLGGLCISIPFLLLFWQPLVSALHIPLVLPSPGFFLTIASGVLLWSFLTGSLASLLPGALITRIEPHRALKLDD